MEKNVTPQKLVLLSADPLVMQAAAAVAGRHYEVLRTAEATRAVNWVQNTPSVGVIVVDQTQAGTTGIEVLSQVARLSPNIRRVLVTSMDTLESLVDALHSGVVQHFVQKPVKGVELLAALTANKPRSAAA